MAAMQQFVSTMSPGESLAPWFTFSVLLASFGLLLADRDRESLSIMMISLSIFLVVTVPGIYFRQRMANSTTELVVFAIICLILLAIFIWEIIIIVQQKEEKGRNVVSNRKAEVIAG